MKSKLKLLTLISYKFLPARTGGEIAHVHFHNHIADYLDNYVVGSAKNNAEGTRLKFKLVSLFKNKYLTYLQLPYLFSLLLLIKKEKIDFIMCSHPYLGFLGYLASLLTGKAMISYSHNIESERFKSLGKWWSALLFYYERWLLNVSKIVFFVTEEDRQWALSHYGIHRDTTRVSPFGIHLQEPPIKDPNYKARLQKKYKLESTTKILYFVGTFPYEPNNQAVDFILQEINPRLKNTGLDYKIFVAGKNLDMFRQEQIKSSQNIIYMGFVDDIRELLDSADIMLNPMLLGGGIKTKAVEALGHNIKVVSTENGAFGLDKESCKNMLFTSEDNDWTAYTDNIISAIQTTSSILPDFYLKYYWGHVTQRVVKDLERLK